MKIREVLEYVDEIMENVFSEKVKLRWLNQIEAELQTEVLLLAAEGVVQYTEADMDAELIAPPPYDELYAEYLQYRICLAQEEPERANNKAATYNRIYTAYQIYVAGTANPGNGMAERLQYYLSAYQLDVKRGYMGSEEEWLKGLHGKDGVDGKDGTGVAMKVNEQTGMLEIEFTGSTDGSGSVGGKGDPGVGVAEIRYDADTKQWSWVDTEGVSHDFEGPAVYTASEIDSMFGSYITDVAALVGGDA